MNQPVLLSVCDPHVTLVCNWTCTGYSQGEIHFDRQWITAQIWRSQTATPFHFKVFVTHGQSQICMFLGGHDVNRSLPCNMLQDLPCHLLWCLQVHINNIESTWFHKCKAEGNWKKSPSTQVCWTSCDHHDYLSRDLLGSLFIQDVGNPEGGGLKFMESNSCV